MKKNDIAMIVLIASISMAIAYFSISAIPGLKDALNPVTVPTIGRFSPDVAEPDPDVFNAKAINPTVEVTIGKGQ